MIEILNGKAHKKGSFKPYLMGFAHVKKSSYLKETNREYQGT